VKIWNKKKGRQIFQVHRRRRVLSKIIEIPDIYNIISSGNYEEFFTDKEFI
jgi:hypothetical protein